MKSYVYTHIVNFQETNVVGNVYYANYLNWQGKCRELFLRDNVPDILEQIKNGLYLVTTKVSCEYFNELFAFDQVEIHMFPGKINLNKVQMKFEYWKVDPLTDEKNLISKGEQEIACLQKNGELLESISVPASFREALYRYQ